MIKTMIKLFSPIVLFLCSIVHAESLPTLAPVLKRALPAVVNVAVQGTLSLDDMAAAEQQGRRSHIVQT